ncbi:cartilage intermediate layer protein 1-like [Oculina patagonica]
MEKFVLQALFLVWMLAVTVVSSPTEKRQDRASGCPSDQLSKFSIKYAKELQKRVLNMIHFARPDDRSWLTEQRHFKRRLLMWGFQQMDRNKNGLVDYNEAARGRWSLRGPRVCQLAFLRKCDEDQSRSVSLKEWQNCFKITSECNKTCLRGQLDTDLCQCQCPDSVIHGRVVTTSGAPLQDVSIWFGISSRAEMARTNKSGHFSMIDRCENSSYTLRKNDYIPLRLEGGIQRDGHPLLIRLEDAEPAFVSVNPKSKTRIAGQSANFTCEAEVTLPIEISWYHNGRRLKKVTMGTKSNLFIPNVNGAQGFYTCKSTNDYGSEISSPAELKVQEEILDTCNRTPRSHVIKLPPGCKVASTGEDTLDIGQCSDEPCSQTSSLSHSCGAKEDCCCGPVSEDHQERIVVNCGVSYNDMVFYRLKGCGCGTCAKRETVIKGEVVGGPDRVPVKNVKVIFRKKVVDRTNEEGKFSFTLSDDVDRVVVTFHDPTDRFFNTTQTVPILKSQTVSHINIALPEEDPPVTFDSSQDLRVPLGHAEDNMAELEFPADNLLHKDGKPFKGKAKLRVSWKDARNVSDLLTTPGDFTTVDQSGDVQPLKTYGILRIKVQDEDNEQLDLAGNMKIHLDPDKTFVNLYVLPPTGEMAPWLWWLNENTGRWRQMGEMKPVNNSRTKRSLGGRRFYIGDIQTDKLSYINIDILWKRCYVRAQAYTMTNKGMQPVMGAVVTLIGKENTNQEQYYGYTKEITNKNGIACIPAWCDSNVVLQSTKLSCNADGSERVSKLNLDDTILEKLAPELEASVIEGNESRSFQFTTKVTSQAGPIFGGDEMNKCVDLSDSLLAFSFRLDEAEVKLNELDDFGSRPPGHPLSWYTTDASKPNQEPKKCFLKIKTEYRSQDSVPWVSVQSFTPDRQTRYGFSSKEQSLTKERPTNEWYVDRVASACVEYRCSEKDKETFLVVTMLTTASCFYDVPITAILEFQPNFTIAISSRSAGFYAPIEISDGKLGFYSGPGKIAQERCKAGTVDDVGEGVKKINSDGHGLLAFDAPECPLYEWMEFRNSGPN